jgi:RNA polymerase sigma factor (TIGR02999 family)
MSTNGQVTRLLSSAHSGDQDAVDRLVELVYDEMRQIAEHHFRRERPNHTLQPTALVNEAYARMVDQRNADWKSRTHFLAIASRQMFRILADHARARGAAKRGGGLQRVTLDGMSNATGKSEVDFLDLEEALRDLGELDPRGRKVVEMRYLAGMNVREVGEALGISERTVADDWRTARAWLHQRLQSLAPRDSGSDVGPSDDIGR